MAVRLRHPSLELLMPLLSLLLFFNLVFFFSHGVKFDDALEKPGAELLDWPRYAESHQTTSDHQLGSISDKSKDDNKSTTEEAAAAAAAKIAEAAESRVTQAPTAIASTAATAEKSDEVRWDPPSAGTVQAAAAGNPAAAGRIRPKRDDENEEHFLMSRSEEVERNNLKDIHMQDDPTLFVGKNGERDVYKVSPPTERVTVASAAAGEKDYHNTQQTENGDGTQEQIPVTARELSQRREPLHERQHEATVKERDEVAPKVREQISRRQDETAEAKEAEAAAKVEAGHSESQQKPTEEEAKVASNVEEPPEMQQELDVQEKAGTATEVNEKHSEMQQEPVEEEKSGELKTMKEQPFQTEGSQSITSYLKALANRLASFFSDNYQKEAGNKDMRHISANEIPGSHIFSTSSENDEKILEKKDVESPQKIASSPALSREYIAETAQRESSGSGRIDTSIENILSTDEASPTALEAKAENDLEEVDQPSSLEAVAENQDIQEDKLSQGTETDSTSSSKSIQTAVLDTARDKKQAVQNALSLPQQPQQTMQRPPTGDLTSGGKAIMPNTSAAAPPDAENIDKKNFKDLAEAIHASRVALLSVTPEPAAYPYEDFHGKIYPQAETMHARHTNRHNHYGFERKAHRLKNSNSDFHGNAAVEAERTAAEKSFDSPYDYYETSAAGQRGREGKRNNLTEHSFEVERARALRGRRSNHIHSHSREHVTSSSDSWPAKSRPLPTNILTEKEHDRQAHLEGDWTNHRAATAIPSSMEEAFLVYNNWLDLLRIHEKLILHNSKRLLALLESIEREQQQEHVIEQYQTGAESPSAMRGDSKQQGQENQESQTEQTKTELELRSVVAHGNDAFQQEKPESPKIMEPEDGINKALRHGTSSRFKSRSFYFSSGGSLASLIRSFETALQRFEVSLKQLRYSRDDVLEGIAKAMTVMEEYSRAFELAEAKVDQRTESPEELMERQQATKEALITQFALIATAQKRAESVLALAEILKVTQTITSAHLRDALEEEMQHLQNLEEAASWTATEKEKSLLRQQQVERADKLSALSEAFHAVKELGILVADVTWADIEAHVANMHHRAIELVEQMKSSIEMTVQLLREQESGNNALPKKQPSKKREKSRPMNAVAHGQQKIKMANTLSRRRGEELLSFRLPENTAAKQEFEAHFTALKDKARNAGDLVKSVNSEGWNIVLESASGIPIRKIEPLMAKQAALPALNSNVPTIIIGVLLVIVLLLFIGLLVSGYFMIASYESQISNYKVGEKSGQRVQSPEQANIQDALQPSQRVASTDWR